MDWFARLRRNAAIGAIVYGLLAGCLALLSLLRSTQAGPGWASDWPLRLLGVGLYAIIAGAFLGAGCTSPPWKTKTSSVLTIVLSLIGGTGLLYPIVSLGDPTAEPGTILGTIGFTFALPTLIATVLAHLARHSKDAPSPARDDREVEKSERPGE